MVARLQVTDGARLSRIGYSLETPSWRQVAEHFLLELCGSSLDMKAFDTV